MQEKEPLGEHEGKEVLHYMDPRTDPSHDEFDEDAYHNCPGCQKPTINARIRALNGDRRCIECTATKAYKGCMDYSHKTAPVLMVTKDPEQFRQIRKIITHQR
jgi:hypothetical protein